MATADRPDRDQLLRGFERDALDALPLGFGSALPGPISAAIAAKTRFQPHANNWPNSSPRSC